MMYTASKPTRVTQLIAMTGLATLTVAGLAVPAAADEPDTSARTKCVEGEAPYYFHGEPLVEGTFDQTEPDSDRVAPSFQHTSSYRWPLPTENFAYWEAGFTGQLCGEIEFTLYASKGLSTDPVNVKALPTGPVNVELYADRPGSADNFIGWSGPVLEESTVTSNEKQEVSVGVRDDGAVPAVTDALIVRIKDWNRNDPTNTTFYYDHPDYAANFRISTLQPCEVADAHPDCAFTDGLRNLVNEYANSGDVTEDGRTQLLAALDDAKAAFDSGDAEATVAALEEFKRLALDPELVTTTAARDVLISAADTLIAAVGT